MTTPTPSSRHFRYSPALVALHWLMAALFVAVYASIELRVFYAKGTEMRDLMKALHFSFGLGVLLMVTARLAARRASPLPQPGPTLGLETWVHRLGSLGHLALYALMVGMPLLGWLALSAAGKPVAFFGLELPALMAPDKAWAHDIKEVHEAVGVAGYWLIGLHVVAALGHHYGLKDGLLARMSLHSAPGG